MRVEVLFIEGCPNHRPAVERVRAAIEAEGLSAQVSEVLIVPESAATPGFAGSPTILVNGRDIEPTAGSAAPSGYSCRSYPGGLPAVETIRAALREAARAG